ncbi:uncharacterized protein L201_000105 [Kwoniella dendrophila CBS 6074]|uniref:Uncharacterized protein n=1 Tax=Kwoniella dendrophila CBS 6074 TaxID=1295534 RepID=A0AAX4JLE2_9TREE
MATTVIRSARPEAILIVLFLVIALFVFLGGGSKKGRNGSSSSSQREDDKNSRKTRRGNGESDLESGKSDRRDRKRSNNKSPTSSEDEESRKNRKEKERQERRKKRKEEEEKQKREQQQSNQNQGDEEVPRINPPDIGDLNTANNNEGGPMLSSKVWERDPTKRPERPSGRSPPILLKRDENNHWTRGPLSGKKGVKFDDNGIQGKELNSIVNYNKEDSTTKLYNQNDSEMLKNHISNERGRDSDFLFGKIDGTESPLRNILMKESNFNNGSKENEKLILLMKKLEWSCSIDQLNLLNKIPFEILKESNELINNNDLFINGLGSIPIIILDIIKLLLKNKIIDLPLIISSHSQPNLEFINSKIPYDEDPKITPLDKEKVEAKFLEHILEHCKIDIKDVRDNLNPAEWKKLKSDQIQKIVYDWVKRKLNLAFDESNNNSKIGNEENQFDIYKLLLGYFIPYYRGTTSYKPKHFRTNEKIPGFKEKVGNINNGVVEWLRYIGKFLLISKMFSYNGVELSKDLELKVQISKRSKQVGFIVDYTLFIPKYPNSKTSKEEELDPTYLDRTISNVSSILERVKYLSLLWVNHLNDLVYPQKDSTKKLFSDLYPFQINRLTFRPGLPLRTINYKDLQLSSSSNPGNTENDQNDGRDIEVINDISIKRIEGTYERYKETRKICDLFSGCYRTMTCQMIRFINKRQYHWYKPSSSSTTPSIYEKFDLKTFEILLILIGPSLTKLTYSESFKMKLTGNKIKDKETMLFNDFSDKIKYTQLHAIDFGGILPLQNNTNNNQKFIKLNLFRGLKWLLLPLTFNNTINGKQIISSSNLIVNEKYGLSNYLFGQSDDLGNSLIITFHGKSSNDRQLFLNDLKTNVLNQLNEWIRDYQLENNHHNDDMFSNINQDRIKRRLIDKLNLTKNMIKTRIKFVIINSHSTDSDDNHQTEIEDPSDENDLSNLTLNDFDISQEMLPPDFRS